MKENSFGKGCVFRFGVMGYPMAGHLKAGGYDVTVYNRTAEKADKWVAEYEGAKADTPADARKDVICICLCRR